RAVPVAITGQSSWPSAGHSLATYGQLFMAAYSKAMSQAWQSRPTRRDGGVPIRARYDRSRSDDARQGYIEAIRHRDA
ncbi:hypothetical protein, partial [Micrococcus luteus]|uniref:hypothetical protein n=1 Tax=Micrococcus luteus TaxID=1270 RepID=UPI003817713C